MGFILSKFRRKKSTQDVLEGLEKEIKRINQNKRQSLVSQSTVVRKILTYGLIFWVLASGCIFYLYRSAQRTEDYIIFLPILVLIPGLLFFFRKVLTWWYHSKISKDDKKLSKLQEEKSKILDEVMEKETYKIATQILEKYDPSRLATKNSDSRGGSSGGGGGLGRPSPVPLVVSASAAARGGGQQRPGGPVTSPGGMDLRKRAVPPPGSMNRSLNQSMTAPPGRKEGGPVNLNQTIAAVPRSPPSHHHPSMGGGGRGGGGMPPMGMGRGGGPPLPRPIIPRERGIMDRMVEYLVGDGPSNRYALICRQCQSHNGMALREEFEFISYRCCYCHYWNPARKQRPIAPRLPVPPPPPPSSTSSSVPGSVPGSPKTARSGQESEGVSESEKGSPNPRKSIDEKSDEKTDDDNSSEVEKTDKETDSCQDQGEDEETNKLSDKEDLINTEDEDHLDSGLLDSEKDEEHLADEMNGSLTDDEKTDSYLEQTQFISGEPAPSQHIELINKDHANDDHEQHTEQHHTELIHHGGVEDSEPREHGLADSAMQDSSQVSASYPPLEEDSSPLMAADLSSEQMDVDS